jgi:hypothetical protein
MDDPTPTYGTNQLPDGPWRDYVKTTPTRMCQITGPCTIYTLEGPLDMPSGWEGWLAVDSKGHPYPIDAEVHASTYTEAPEPVAVNAGTIAGLGQAAEQAQALGDAVARFRALSDAAGNPGAPGPTCPARYCLSGSHTHTCTRPYAHPDRGHHCACGDGWSANPDELPHPFRQAAVDDTECGMCGRDVADLLHAAPPGEPLAHALNHLAATLTDIQTRLDAIAARLPLRPTVERTPPGVWTLPGERGPEPVVPAWGAAVDPARSTKATFHPADAPGIDGSPAWAYDEDGYCVSCGNGRWKHHMPGCELRDALDAVDREAPPPDEGAPTEGDEATCGATLDQGCNVTGTTHTCNRVVGGHRGGHRCPCGTSWPLDSDATLVVNDITDPMTVAALTADCGLDGPDHQHTVECYPRYM